MVKNSKTDAIGCLVITVILGVSFFSAIKEMYYSSPIGFSFVLILFSSWIAYNFGHSSGEEYQKTKADNLLKDQASAELAKINSELNDRRLQINQTVKQLKEKESALELQLRSRMDNADKRIAIMRDGIHHLRDETLQTYPWLAKLYADYVSMYDGKLESELRNKTHPAIRAADSVASIAREKRVLQQTVKMLEYQLHFYETVFPWLEEFKELDPKIAYDIATQSSSTEEADPAINHHLLSPIEYDSLSTSEKFQLALDRYNKRSKTSWQIGIEYERYIGYTMEMNGCLVKYQGALSGLNDLGRDLVVTKNGKTTIIQCKRWAKTKTIHEKHIFQLFGSKISWEIENKGKHADAILYSTTNLSATAKKYADYLGVQVVIKEMEAYPQIKCNIGHDGTKIYHLPFDQHYDRLYITPSKGDLYVKTVAEAEKLGFRRSYRWNGYKS